MATKYYEDVINKSGLETVRAEDLQKKFDAVTEAEYDKQRTELQNTENKFYNKLYDTQQTTMDTIRQNNASAVATGASKGIQAANELSALLGLQQESVEGATDIANQATTLAQDETQAMLENALTAEQQAQEANQALANILVQAGSVDVEGQNADTAWFQALEQSKQQWQQLIEQIRQTNPPLANLLQRSYESTYGPINTGKSGFDKLTDFFKDLTSTSNTNTTNSNTSSAPTGTELDMNIDKSSTQSVLRHQMLKELLQDAGYSGDVYGTDIPEGYTVYMQHVPGLEGKNYTLKYVKGKWYATN